MFIPIPIPPISAKHVATVQGTVWKFVSCAHCQQPYAYLLDLEASGESHDLLFMDGKDAAEQAQAKAEENFARKGRNVELPIPCPNCGFFQDDMSRKLKEDASINWLQITGVVIAVLSLVPLAFNISYVWLLTFVLAVVGLALITYGYVVAFGFDPNTGDPEPRKALGRTHALWGEQLDELLAMNANAEKTSRHQ
jgi:hypothetical protein